MGRRLYHKRNLLNLEEKVAIRQKMQADVLKLTFHLKLHGKDYSSQRGLWKILRNHKRLLGLLLLRTFN
ncbi:hypothetical protein CY35_05G092600 [Sphagnum magellanicum]|nr:hypothetical protein CY35_05G092600 [Sphagnum magellanicum]